MFKVLTCLATEHDLRLVVVAGLVCFGGCFTAFRLYSRMRTSAGHGVRAAWVLLTGLVAGCSVWATHFIAMLSYETGLRSGFLPMGTLASLLIAGVFMAAAFAAAAFAPGRAGKIAGGLLAGFGVGAMHYTGMSAYVTEGVLAWDLNIVAGSVLVGVGVALAAMFVARDARLLSQQLIGGLLLTIAICSLHFAGMGAITVIPDPSIDVPAQLLSSVMMTVAVALIVGLIILGGLGAVLIEGGANAQALNRIRRLADAAYEGIVVVRGDRIQDANAAFCALAGTSVGELIGERLEGDLLILDDAAGIALDARREGRLRPRGGGEEIPVEAFGRMLEAQRGGSGDLMVLAVRDLRERRSAEEKIRYLAEHDGLTGLANRNMMQARLAQAMDRIAVTGESLSVICIDLDHFKEANDLHGHLAGDAILTETARRLQQSVVAPAFAARLGGDEFVVVQIGVEDQPAAAAELCTTLLEVLSAPVTYADQDLQVGASLGVSLYPDDGATGEALLANADMALYRAKEDGRGSYRFFKREMDESIRERRTLARELRQAILDEELVLHYQPLARAEDGEICGFEALVRWRHPTRGMVAPIDFIPVAEESGLILPLGEWVLRKACADAAAWDRPLRIAVNLSPVQLHQANLAAVVHEVLLETGLAPRRLELEITETALFKDYQRALDNLRRLKALGVRIAMDDFGTGFSSLSTLQSFPFDKIKIDKSFVENIHRHERATAIVRAVLGLGRSLDIPVTAEGVETPEQLEFLRGEACAEVQGYAIGRPGPMGALDDWTEAPVLKAG
ncbi:diguanylate phosphodiesterase [Phenylobacterium sp. Root77]|uniref:bifunctional diguanylate cyclase/phosphodiesterase n=1 Tax=unclassified Phenylobacterium TaxID=2640670 RepID=UPI0006F32B65|nr:MULTISPECIES: EAL domain-containing protein [unclassified Phenylobacterium]KQW69183.1 diguanylate phosphodiesterase [Phenylobacterium sp. Root1277]KQW95450.1 diguanylate phosphodiesterase [Phenylobacterium sp. Root1290]KRC41240.1 diguanylate phosphodiesterase [Phenylobacterium sp. Root77]